MNQLLSDVLGSCLQVIEFESTALMIGQLGLRVNLIAYPVISVKKVCSTNHPLHTVAVWCTLVIYTQRCSWLEFAAKQTSICWAPESLCSLTRNFLVVYTGRDSARTRNRCNRCCWSAEVCTWSHARHVQHVADPEHADLNSHWAKCNVRALFWLLHIIVCLLSYTLCFGRCIENETASRD